MLKGKHAAVEFPLRVEDFPSMLLHVLLAADRLEQGQLARSLRRRARERRHPRESPRDALARRLQRSDDRLAQAGLSGLAQGKVV